MDTNLAKEWYEQMLIIRHAEEALQKLFADGLLPGFVHLSIGQEAVPVGISSFLRDTDTVSSNHRGHGHALAKGVDLEGFFSEILGRSTGLCKGRGGSMHVADLSRGMLGANGIVGAGLPITTGSALALKLQGEGNIAAVYFGDGAMAEGVLHECMNIAALWQLPMLFVCENNGWSEFSPTNRQMTTTLDKLANAFNVEYSYADGNRVSEVASVAGAVIEKIRNAARPAVLDCHTTRVRGHFEGDRQDYRDADELAGLAERDPLRLARKELVEQGVEESWFNDVDKLVSNKISTAREAAVAAPHPEAAEIATDVYTTHGAV